MCNLYTGDPDVIICNHILRHLLVTARTANDGAAYTTACCTCCTTTQSKYFVVIQIIVWYSSPDKNHVHMITHKKCLVLFYYYCSDENLLVLCWQVQFELSDATKRTFAANSFDIIYSRDTILHIKDKKSLFANFWVRLI